MQPESLGPQQERGATRALVLGAVGVVFGDIGTSPLYAVRLALGGPGGLAHGEESVLGVLSLIFWSLVIIVTLKYVLLILRADNRGEGGVLALAALGTRDAPLKSRRRVVVVLLSIAGLALFGGDGLITPAISVLSAVEGLKIVTPVFEPYVLPVAVAILVGLFVLQRRGTARMGKLFGPIMCLWFATIAVLGVVEIAREPGILRALDPTHAVRLFELDGWHAFVILGAVVLVVTGAEALYTDMGHFGRRPIRIAWLGICLPALTLNYFGQGALVLRLPAAVEHPFFLLAPSWALAPLVLLATLATIIASQAVISGAFSVTRQAVRLGYLPRMVILHTSETEIGQVYMPRVNWILACGVVLLVVGFGSSNALAGAYGVAVMGAMTVDTVLAGMVAASLWRWNPLLAGLLFAAFLAVDLGFLAATLLKIPEGGWLPLLVAAVAFVVVTTWRRGREVLHERLYRDALPVETFLKRLESSVRVAGTAVFMTGDASVIPNALLHNMKHNKVLHERVVLMTVATEDVPRVSVSRRVEVERLGKGFHTVIARYGFMEYPNVPAALELCRGHGLPIDMMETSFILGRETLIASPRPDMGPLQEQLFIAMSTTALSATTFFGIPPGRVVELGTQIEI